MLRKHASRLINCYGKRDLQIYVAIEEFSELTKELTKYLRGQIRIEKLVEELSDALLCAYYVKEFFNIPDIQILENAEKKLIRDSVIDDPFEIKEHIPINKPECDKDLEIKRLEKINEELTEINDLHEQLIADYQKIIYNRIYGLYADTDSIK